MTEKECINCIILIQATFANILIELIANPMAITNIELLNCDCIEFGQFHYNHHIQTNNRMKQTLKQTSYPFDISQLIFWPIANDEIIPIMMHVG